MKRKMNYLNVGIAITENQEFLNLNVNLCAAQTISFHYIQFYQLFLDDRSIERIFLRLFLFVLRSLKEEVNSYRYEREV